MKVVHQLEVADLEALLGPVLRLEPFERLAESFGNVVGTKETEPRLLLNELQEMEFSFLGYELRFEDLRRFEKYGSMFTMQMRRPIGTLNFLVSFVQIVAILSNLKVIRALKRLVSAEMCRKHFETLQITERIPFEEAPTYWWQIRPAGYGSDMYLVIKEMTPCSIDVNVSVHFWFVAFHFNPACFNRVGECTSLRWDWRDYASYVSD